VGKGGGPMSEPKEQNCRGCHWARIVSGTDLIVMCGAPAPEWVEPDGNATVRFYNDGKECPCWKPEEEVDR
jgi:hypothetical protein